MNIVCAGPGPHNPASGVLGQSDKPVSGMRCAADPCRVADDPALTARGANGETIRQQAVSALVGNRTFVALASPTNAQVVAQVKALTRQNNALIRLALGQLDGTD